MPLGDPQGSNFVYTDEGKPTGLVMATIRVSSLDMAIEFYRDLLKMAVLQETEAEAVMACGEQMIMLKRSPADWVGGDTGLVLSTDSIYDLHRRLIDEAVVFAQPPERRELVLTAVLSDDDGNLLTFIELSSVP